MSNRQWDVLPPLPDTEFDQYDEEQAFSLNQGEYYLSIQLGDGYYDYTIYHGDFTDFDGGQLDEPDMTILEAVETILNEFDLGTLYRFRVDYDELLMRTDEAAQKEFESIRIPTSKDPSDFASLNDLISKAVSEAAPFGGGESTERINPATARNSRSTDIPDR